MGSATRRRTLRARRFPPVRRRAVRVRARQRRRRRWRLSSPCACALTGSATFPTRRSGPTAYPAGARSSSSHRRNRRLNGRLNRCARKTCPTSCRRPQKRRRPMMRRSSTPCACGQTACPTFLIPTAKERSRSTARPASTGARRRYRRPRRPVRAWTTASVRRRASPPPRARPRRAAREAVREGTSAVSAEEALPRPAARPRA